MTAVAQPQEISIDSIVIEDNPRDTFDKKGESFKALVASVKTHGIISAITVEPRNGGFGLIAGQRRVAAAKAAGMKTIPALVRSPNGSTAAMAVSENIHRESLSPIQEGKAFKRALETLSEKEVAAAYSVSADFIRGRVRLLKLPASLAKGVDRGEIPLGAASLLASIAEHSEPLAKAIAAELGSGETNLHELINQTGTVINSAVLRSKDKNLIAFHARAQFLREYDVRGFSKAQLAKLNELYELRPRYQYAPLLSEKDVDAARAYGCLLTVVDGFGRETELITDADWLYEHLEANLTRLAEKGDQERGQERKRKDPDTASALSEDEEKRRADERADQKQLRIAAIHRNLELGEDIAVKAKEVPIDKDVMSVLGELILHSHGTDLFLRGFRYTWPKGKHVEPGKREGTVPKVERISTREAAAEHVQELWAKCKTPEQMAGFLVQLLVAARYADQSETTNADRRTQPIPWLADWGADVPTVRDPNRGAKALDRIAARIVPRSVKAWTKDALKRHEEKRAADDEIARANRESAGLPVAGADFEDEDDLGSG